MGIYLHLPNRDRFNLSNVSRTFNPLPEIVSRGRRRDLEWITPKTMAYVNRVKTDGGQIVNIKDIDRAYRLIDKYGLSPVLWLSASFGYKDAGSNKVSKIYDLTSNNNDASQATTDNQSTFVSNQINGRPVFDCDGNDIMSITTVNMKSMLSVFNRDAVTATKAIFLSYSDYTAHYFGGNFTYATGSYGDCGNFQGGVEAFSPVGDQNTSRIYRMKYNNILYVGRNGVFGTGVTQSTAYNAAINYIFGYVSSSTYSLDGKIAEIIIFNSEISADRFTALENYLNKKYAVY